MHAPYRKYSLKNQFASVQIKFIIFEIQITVHLLGKLKFLFLFLLIFYALLFISAKILINT